MPPVSERAARVRFRRALSLMAMTLVAPGSAQLVAGNRRVGLVALRLWLGLLGLLLVTLAAVAVHRDLVFWLVSNTSLLLLLRVVLIAGAVGWAFLFFDAWRLGQPLSLGLGHRRAIVSVNGVLCLSVAGTLLFGAHLVAVQRDFIVTMFGDGDVTGAHSGRFNVLLMGGDSGAGRWGLRPDSMTVASIDADSGRTVLISLPRNMEDAPFRKGTVMHKQFPERLRLRGLLPQRRQHLGRRPHRSLPQVRQPRRRRDDHGDRGRHRPADQLLGDGQPRGVQEPGRRGRRRGAQRARPDPDRRPRLRRLRLHRARHRNGSTASRRSGSPGLARAPTTTRGWRGRSA